MNAYPCVVVNNSGQTIWVKIVGYHWDMFSMPEHPGPGNDGLLYSTNGQQQSYSPYLLEGDRVVVVFNKDGIFLAATNVPITAPATIAIGVGGVVTCNYTEGEPVAHGN